MPTLFDSVNTLSGVGPVRASQLAALGIYTLYDLISYFPRDYEDRTKLVRISQLEPDRPACFEAMVVSQPRTSYIRKGMELTKLTVSDNTANLSVTFFNQSYMARNLIYGQSYLFYGRLSSESIRPQMLNPVFEPVEKSGVKTNRIMPIYSLTSGISNAFLVQAISQALRHCGQMLPEILPPEVRQEHGLIDGPLAYEIIHNPPDFETLEEAKRRLVFEEFFIFSTGLALARARRTASFHPPYDDLSLKAFDDALPFQLTSAQRRCILEVQTDFAKDVPMNRIVQGDVGSGKTMVAAAAAYLAIRNGKQVAIMAPTEILAEQHFKTISSLFTPLGIQAGLLTGSKKAAEKRAVKQQLCDGTLQIVIGTHALLSEDVTFSALDLVIADEQHKFGVAQRSALAEKGESPHLLVMSATPIPRTLALLLYGDLDLSILDELPPGRQQIETVLVGEAMRPRLNAFIQKQVDEGHQVYIVCPAVEESEEHSLKSAEAWRQTLQRTVFPNYQVGLLHGKLKGPEKDAAIGAFAAGKDQILVCTTVVEVGIDVPNATLIVIEDADRFGLSQLHQLRGRVGRGTAQSYCVLVSSNRSEETRARLKALCATNDGFQIAEQDLAQRGPGDFFGQRQHGLPQFKVANLALDLSILKKAQEAAARVLSQSPDSIRKNPPLLARIRALFSSEGTIFN